MSNAQLEEKFHVLADEVLGKDNTAQLLSLAWSIEGLKDASEICRAACRDRRKRGI